MKVKMYTIEWHSVNILQEEILSITDTLKNNRHIENERIFLIHLSQIFMIHISCQIWKNRYKESSKLVKKMNEL